MAEWCIPFWSLWPWHWLLASFLGFLCLEHISYITAYFPQMYLLLDQFLWGHSSRYCDMSCFIIQCKLKIWISIYSINQIYEIIFDPTPLVILIKRNISFVTVVLDQSGSETREHNVLFFNQNICCGYSKEPSQCDGSFKNPKHPFKPRIRRKSQFYAENFA